MFHIIESISLFLRCVFCSVFFPKSCDDIQCQRNSLRHLWRALYWRHSVVQKAVQQLQSHCYSKLQSALCRPHSNVHSAVSGVTVTNSRNAENVNETLNRGGCYGYSDWRCFGSILGRCSMHCTFVTITYYNQRVIYRLNYSVIVTINKNVTLTLQ